MSVVVSFVPADEGGTFGLTSSECKGISHEVYRLITQGFACGVGEYEQDGITYSYVLDRRSETYTVGRHASVYFLIDPDFNLVELDLKLDRVLKALTERLGLSNDAYKHLQETQLA